MIKNYLKIAWRNLLKNKTFSLVNIAGLSLGMAVALLIGLWMHDEVTFNRAHENHDRIVAIMQHQTFNGVKGTQSAVPYLLGDEIRQKYGPDFKHVVMSSWMNTLSVNYGDNAISAKSCFFEPAFPEMMSLNMLNGTRAGLTDPHSAMLSASTAKALFGDQDPIGKVLKVANQLTVKVTGVYEDLPYNTAFRELSVIMPFELFLSSQTWIREMENPWRSNFVCAYGQLADHADLEKVSAKIKDVKLHKVRADDAAFKPEIFLHPMSKWHLYGDWKDGFNTGGRIQFVWLFGIIGAFVLLLACINFMNLSTARSEKRAKEVGIRKSIGSVRSQLLMQFFSESILLALISFAIALVLVQLSLPLFNEVADKRVTLPLPSPLFWLTGLGFAVLTGVLAGSYPALYLSSFAPVKVLKGTYKAGNRAVTPRRLLVVLQFAVSVMLMIGTVVVFKQIRFAKNRPAAYNREGLIAIDMNTPELEKNFAVIRDEMKASGAVTEMAYSTASTTDVNAINNGYTWRGMEPSAQGNFIAMGATHDFGKTIGWQIKEGRDFSREYASDSSAMILNEAAVKFMGLQHPIGEVVKIDGRPYNVVGVIKDMVMESPYAPAFRTAITLGYSGGSVINARLNPAKTTAEALAIAEKIFKKHNPATPFSYAFVDDQYAKKFDAEQRIGKLSAFFAVLAIFISCLGMFGMATFMAEQKVKEIGVRKILGASIAQLWALLSREFVLLVGIALFIATPTAWLLMERWLGRYDYRTDITWSTIAMVALFALTITLVTISYQGIKAALANPVKSLRAE
ncbi:ABC transporter permease [Chitinophaga horti]|uniref:ABC transporter permease n=1 Tax=Chitinophaga horti TaxID=2920382 RepID=A0ABY6J384_9BACT|nr:ABC transporter permease [Chitinophaga horti]UYQ94128.1 ABC transporter permease [Chitinophaga horti]